MKRWLTTLLVFAVCSAAVHADVTVVQTTTIEGGMAAASGQNLSPKMTNHIKGMKSRNDIDAGMIQVIAIADLVSKQVIMLHPDQKTAEIVTAAKAASTTAPAGITLPKVEGSIKPTGKSQVIDGFKCDEYLFTTSVDMSQMNSPQMPPEAAAMLKDVKMNLTGSMWVAKDVPGAAEYAAFQKAAAASDLRTIIAGASGVKMPGMENMMKAMGDLNGLTYLTEMTMTVEGSGQMAEMMQQMGAMKITTKVSSISTDPIGDDLFKIPEGYTVIKR